MGELPTIRDLYPDCSDEEMEQAEANIRRYLGVITRIAERMAAENRAPQRGDLTDSEPRATVSDERSKPHPDVNN